MKHLKKLGLAVVLGAASLTTFAGSAFADSFTSSGSIYTGEIVATSTNPVLIGKFTTVKCTHSEFKTNVEEHGGGWEDAGGLLTHLTFTECNYVVTVENKGGMDVDAEGAGSGNFDLFSTKFSVHTSVGTCIFTANSALGGGTAMGNFTGNYWSNAVIDLEGEIPRTGGNFFCGSSGILGGIYKVTKPSNLAIHGI